VPEPQPRRRISDKDRRRWSDDRLDDFKADVLSDIEDLKLDRRVFARLPGEVAALNRALEQLHKDVRELRQENRSAHTRVEKKVDTTVDQTSRNPMKDFLIAALAAATGIGVPIMLAQVLH
jgi:hypothetical protein